MAFHSPCSLDNPQICYTLWSKFHLAICRQMLLVISKSKTLPSSFRPIFSKIFLTIASYTILYGLTPLLCILWHRALSTEPSVILPLWIRISHIPASKTFCWECTCTSLACETSPSSKQCSQTSASLSDFSWLPSNKLLDQTRWRCYFESSFM